MITIILPGYSPSNKDWAYSIKDNLNLGHEVIVHEWKHWTTGSFSLKFETEKIKEEVGNNELNIIAKSVGTRVVMHLTPLLKSQIKRVILCGIPTKGTSESAFEVYKSGLSHLDPSQVVVFQNQKDPFAKYIEIKKFIGKINSKIKIIKMPRADHNYPYTEQFMKFLLA